MELYYINGAVQHRWSRTALNAEGSQYSDVTTAKRIVRVCILHPVYFGPTGGEFILVIRFWQRLSNYMFISRAFGDIMFSLVVDRIFLTSLCFGQ